MCIVYSFLYEENKNKLQNAYLKLFLAATAAQEAHLSLRTYQVVFSKVWKYASMQVCKYASMQACKHASMKVYICGCKQVGR